MGASEVISHAAPTFCIQVPTLDAMEAIHSQRNQVCDNGAHGLWAMALGTGMAVGVNFHSMRSAKRVTLCLREIDDTFSAGLTLTM